MPQVTANNYTMHYQVDDFTDPWTTPETLWIQHGFGRNLNFWYQWIPLLAGQYRVLRRDMRGHGQSADPGPDYVWSDQSWPEWRRHASVHRDQLLDLGSAWS